MPPPLPRLPARAVRFTHSGYTVVPAFYLFTFWSLSSILLSFSGGQTFPVLFPPDRIPIPVYILVPTTYSVPYALLHKEGQGRNTLPFTFPGGLPFCFEIRKRQGVGRTFWEKGVWWRSGEWDEQQTCGGRHTPRFVPFSFCMPCAHHFLYHFLFAWNMERRRTTIKLGWEKLFLPPIYLPPVPY